MKLFILAIVAIIPLFSYSARPQPLKVYAAASLSNVLTDIAKEFKDTEKINFNFDASSKLAKQIESGAPADLFISADTEWMDYLAGKGKIDSASKTELVSNKLVVIIGQNSKKIPAKPLDLNESFYRHLALAGEAVPAGKFARAALKSEGILTDAFSKKIVNAENVRVALSWVAGSEAEAGIVYATDARIEPKVKIAFEFKEGSYPKIIYPAAIVTGSAQSQAAKDFLMFCKSKKAQEIFKKAGFILL